MLCCIYRIHFVTAGIMHSILSRLNAILAFSFTVLAGKVHEEAGAGHLKQPTSSAGGKDKEEGDGKGEVSIMVLRLAALTMTIQATKRDV